MSKQLQFKLVLLGESAVGKSSLVLRFVKDQFDDYRESTIGGIVVDCFSLVRLTNPPRIAAFLTQTVTLDDGILQAKNVTRLAVTLSQHSLVLIICHPGVSHPKSLAPMYYRNANCAVVVYDITQSASLEKARNWIRELQRQADPSIVIALCGNKSDLAARRQVTQEEAQKYAEEEGLMWAETSAKTGEGVADIFTAIAKKLPTTAPTSSRAGAAGRAGPAGGRAGVDLNKQQGAVPGADTCNC
ncbi:hypothetical protein EW146_g1784 [Bondarzewia mesenterica]|uniref:Uncharacterized protein n=1 Tax=Bondarzewia mesenterica TaxID=1095465 RepID=A0A4S4M4L5_9AGAM|nr:hypothetical protein EW146_g1784 [Bondarzewia mesenterica]